MANYLVSWAIDVDDALDPEAAARQALERILTSERGGAHVFVVQEKASGRRFAVDLGDEDWRDGEPIICEMDPLPQ